MLRGNGRQIGFGTKLYAATLGIVLLSMLIMAAVNFWQTRRAYLDQGKTGIRNVSEALKRSLEMHNRLLDKELQTDMAMLQADLALAGKPMLNENRRETIELKGPSGDSRGRVTIPKLMFGLDFVTLDHTVVDRLAERAGGAAAVYQMVEDRLVCVSASRPEGEGSRPVGRFFQPGDPEYETVAQGETYAGLHSLHGEKLKVRLCPVKAVGSGQVVGALWVGRRILSQALRDLVLGTTVNGHGFSMAYAPDGELLVSPSALFRGIDTLEELEHGRSLLGSGEGAAVFRHGDRRYQVQVQPFAPWQLRFAVAVSEQEIMAGVNRSILSTAGISGVPALAAAVLVIAVLMRQIMGPMRRLAALAREVAGGNFNASMDYRAQDAIGETVASVREMVGELKSRLGFSQGLLDSLPIPCVVADGVERIVFVNQPALDYLEIEARPEDLHGITVAEFFYNDPGRKTIISRAIESKAPVLNVQTEGTTRKGRPIALRVDSAPLYDLDGSFIAAYVLYTDLTENKEQERRITEQKERVVDAARSANAISEQVSTAADELSSQIEQASTGAGQQRDRIAVTASSLEEMSATVLEMSKNASEAAQSGDETKRIAQEGAEVVNGVVQGIGQIRSQAEDLQENIHALGQKAEGVGRVMTVIQDIADQTNLLALNAAIEAARAGEAGRGFAVVADEVRKLAEKTMEATREVGQAVEAIQAGTRQNIETTEQTVSLIQESTDKAGQAGDALSRIVAMVEASADQIRSIATAVEEQSTTAEEINRAMEDVNQVSTETSQAMAQSTEAVNELARQAQRLKEVMHELQGGASA